MAAPVGHLTIKFNSIKFNSLGLLINRGHFTDENGPGCCAKNIKFTAILNSFSPWLIESGPWFHCKSGDFYMCIQLSSKDRLSVKTLTKSVIYIAIVS